MKFLLLVLFISIYGCNKSKVTDYKIMSGESELKFHEYKKADPGVFLMAIAEFNEMIAYPKKGAIIAIDSESKNKFERSFLHHYQRMVVADFKRLDNNLYGYFVGRIEPSTDPGKYYFLNKKFQDIHPFPIPNDDEDLDIRAFSTDRDGNLYFLFSRQNYKTALISPEIQGWNRDGKNFFSWNLLEHIKIPENLAHQTDTFHVNGLSIDQKNNLLVNLNQTSQIAYVENITGKLLWLISRDTWTFENDPYNGFLLHHASELLPNGNLLLFDNGDGSDGRLSRAVEYKLDFDKKKATLVWEHRADASIPYREGGGSVQRLENGNTLIGWGMLHPRRWPPKGVYIPVLTEVTSTGEVVREITAPSHHSSYKVYFLPGEKLDL